MATAVKARTAANTDGELTSSVTEWCVQARILLASLVLTAPRQTAAQRQLIEWLLGSARWIDTVRKRSPWVG